MSHRAPAAQKGCKTLDSVCAHECASRACSPNGLCLKTIHGSSEEANRIDLLEISLISIPNVAMRLVVCECGAWMGQLRAPASLAPLGSLWLRLTRAHWPHCDGLFDSFVVSSAPVFGGAAAAGTGNTVPYQPSPAPATCGSFGAAPAGGARSPIGAEPAGGGFGAAPSPLGGSAAAAPAFGAGALPTFGAIKVPRPPSANAWRYRWFAAGANGLAGRPTPQAALPPASNRLPPDADLFDLPRSTPDEALSPQRAGLSHFDSPVTEL